MAARILIPTAARDRVPETLAATTVAKQAAGDYDGTGSVDAAINAPAPARYFPGGELDERPRIVDFSSLDDLSLPSQESGILIVQFWINEAGLVDMIEIEQSNMSPEITRRLIEERRKMLFTAGRKNHVPVRSMVRYEFILSTEAQSKAKGVK